jgi:NADH-quinone oxidoreductase subunit F
MPRLTVEDLKNIHERHKTTFTFKKGGYRAKVTVHMGTCGITVGAKDVMDALVDEVTKNNLKDIIVASAGCAGLCGKEPIVTIEQWGRETIKYCDMNAEKMRKVVAEHIIEGKPVEDYALPPQKDMAFYNLQNLRVLRNIWFTDPEKLEEYIARDGYLAAAKALTEMTREEIIKVVKDSGVRGRGGAGFPTGLKWEFCSKVKSDVKYMLCNGDEGDPGAFMDRAVMEADPHAVIEGMIIAAKAIGAHSGYIYVRAEYPLAVKRLQLAIGQCYGAGLLGKNILNSGFDFDLKIYQGAGAFVCGEETALMRSIEGKRGMPRPRPPFPAHKGLWEKPSVLNNVETLAQIPLIILHGADWYRSVGTEKSPGTKVFCLAGAVNNVGLIEVPMGIPLRTIIYDIGGGMKKGKKFKAVQMGGPSGGCIPESLVDTPVTYEDIVQTGAIMGSGGMVFMDEGSCMVGVTNFFLNFTKAESCGKCVPCRIGTQCMSEILEKIIKGEGEPDDITRLEKLCQTVRSASLCALGGTAPNPVLTTLRYFRDEYESHIKYKRCEAMVCKEIISSACQHACPIGTEASVYTALIALGRYEEAIKVIRKDNPLASVCGRICHHPCETKCKLGEIGNPCSIRALKRFVTDYGLKTGFKLPIQPKELKNQKVAIIGSGPAGLTAGYFLSLEGYAVTVFEAKAEIGGMLRVALPLYRLPREKLDADIEAIKESGVKFRTNTALGKDVSIDGLFNEGYKAIFISVGAHKSMALGIHGEDTEGALPSLKFLEAVNLGKEVKIGKRVGIIGGGNSAVDSARVANRLPGTEKVTLLYRRTREEMPAYKEEVDAAIEEGIDMQFLTAPIKVLTKNGKLTGIECIRMELGEPDASGRRKPVPVKGSEFTVDLDTLIKAIGEQPDISFLADQGLEISKRNTLIADPETLATSREGVFAGGDAATGPKTVIHAISAGKLASDSISKYLKGESLQRQYRVTRPSMYIEPVELTDEEIEKADRPEMPHLPPEDRVKNFKEVELGFTEEMAVREACRCLRCELGTTDGVQAMREMIKKKRTVLELEKVESSKK